MDKTSTNLNEYYTSQGKTLPTVQERSSAYEKAGLGKASEYKGSAEQNKSFLSYLQSGSTPIKANNTPSAVTSSTQVRNLAKEAGVDATKTSAKTFEDFKKSVAPTTEAPTTPGYVDIYQKKRADLGITALEDEINTYDEEKANLKASLDKFKKREATGETLGFAQGRISEEEQNVQDRVDAIERSQNIAINKLNTKNTFIKEFMDLTKDDYSTAKDSYENEYNKNLQLVNAYSTEKNKEVDDARATLTTFNNIISNSGKTFDETFSPTMKAKINELEIQAGMPIGTMETFARSKPKSNVVSTSTGTDEDGNAYTSIISQDPDTGKVSVSNVYSGVKKKTTSGGNALSLSEAVKMGLPSSLVGKTEEEIGNDLIQANPPEWYNEKDIPSLKGLTEKGLQEEWDNFKITVSSNRTE